MKDTHVTCLQWGYYTWVHARVIIHVSMRDITPGQYINVRVAHTLYINVRVTNIPTRDATHMINKVNITNRVTHTVCM